MTVGTFKEYIKHNEVMINMKCSLIETRMDTRLQLIEQKITGSNQLMKFVAALVSVSIFLFGAALKLGWV